jgi:mannose/cellobiose epimerase-like protein (N-acyl-D-glucosamine 2-epimerase family)
MINEAVGEWRTLLTREGELLVADLGTPWKACYHSGRAVHEAICRIDWIVGDAEDR